VRQGSEREIAGLTADSREVRPGFLFAALPGSQTDGARFIRDAVDRGAVAVLAPPGVAGQVPDLGGLPIIEDEQPRRRLSLMAARFYVRQPETIVAVTGTAGKSSVVDFVRQIWTALGRSAGSLGTLGVQSAAIQRKLIHTTPDPVALHRALRELADDGVDHLALEASSHGLDQQRLDGVRIGAAAFTNLSRDHLDYHADAEDYLRAKLRLFDTVLAPGGTAVLPSQSSHREQLVALCRARGHRLLSYGQDAAEVRQLKRRPLTDGQLLTVGVGETQADLRLPLIGDFQALNVLCAIALVLAGGEAAAAVLAAAGGLRGVRGRLELAASHPGGGRIYVDYSHKPEALRNALAALRPHTAGRLVVVFGCGGDRDRGKRPEMGRIAAELADRVIVTDDNPRTEDAAAIRAEVLAGCPEAEEIGDRAAAIQAGIGGLAADDILLLAGKGHEQGQDVAGVVRPFDDAEVARQAVADISGGAS
jgi:UDP-N-acetylmuramoyl-L-alanyl-D-glutamate--2,6-diaminopimelate ligase